MENVDLQTMREVHKNLKKVRTWGVKEKKRKKDSDNGQETKHTKTS
jgi:hypothetical protein